MNRLVKENDKSYIGDIPRMSWDTGEMCEFSSALLRAVRCIGVDADYDCITGASGAAFRFVIDESLWNPGSYGIRNFTADPIEPITAACESVGIPGEYRAPTTFERDRDAIVASINRSVPVVAFGVVGPSDAVIITGFDKRGDVLLGWSTYQDIRDDHDEPHDPTGYFRKSGWHENLNGYLLLQQPIKTIDEHSVAADSLKRIVRVVDTPMLPGRTCGASALSKWERMLRDDDLFLVDEDAFGWRYLCFTINTTMLLDQRTASSYLDTLATRVPECEDLVRSASDLYRRNSETIATARRTIADDFSIEAQQKLKSPQIRREYADMVREIHDRTAAASQALRGGVERIEKLGGDLRRG